MKALINKATLEILKHRLEAATRLLLFIDYDSILIPASAVGAPMALEPEDREQLRELSEKNALTLAVVSNRSQQDLKKMVGFSGIYFLANNGMEIAGPDLNVVHGEAKRVRQELTPLIKKLEGDLKALPGVIMDNRIYSLSVNIAKAKPPIQRKTRLLLEQVWTPVMDSFTLYEARHELIMRPRLGWGKNRAVMFIWNKFSSPRRRPFVMYMGADENDEEIFSQMGREGMGIVMGGTARAARSKAGYQLKNRAEVSRFLTWLSQNVSRIKTSGAAH
ncbi:HAD-IIB family hydrolase [bacterium]|nr:HAD-IIB family hydrolase [bacterium]